MGKELLQYFKTLNTTIDVGFRPTHINKAKLLWNPMESPNEKNELIPMKQVTG